MLKRVWCEIRAYHPTVVWGSEWRIGPTEAVRTVESRCSDCGWVRWRRTGTKSLRCLVPSR